MPKIDHDNYLCIGCGGCAFQCPKQSISMHSNLLGQIVPIIDYNSCIECKICEKICPVYSNEKIEPQNNHNEIVGNYISCYMGYDANLRSTSASGGFVTGVLKSLMDQHLIDYVVCLKNSKKDGCFYQYEFIDQSSHLISCSRSAYYPKEMSQMLKHIKQNDGKYAIVVLPCQAKIIRSLQKKDPILKQRIVFLLGLVCGGMPGEAMVDYITESFGLTKDDITKITFREKKDSEPNSNCGITLETYESEKIRSNFKNGAFGFSYLNKLFHYKGCNVCDDLFAEYADAAFMDAWLPEYDQEKFGRSICIIRNKKLLNVVSSYFTENSNCSEVSIDIPVKAQNSVGLIQRKKQQSYFKRDLYRRLGYISPESGDHKISLTQKTKFFIRSIQEYLIQRKSESLWSEYREGRIDFPTYDTIIHKFVKLIKKI